MVEQVGSSGGVEKDVAEGGAEGVEVVGDGGVAGDIGGGVGGAWDRGDDGGEDVVGDGVGSADGDVVVGELGSN
jgi:hypothetical protein